MPTCLSDDGTSYIGQVLNENEFSLYSDYHKPSVNYETQGPHFIPSYCKIGDKEYLITSIYGYVFYNTQITELYVPSTIKTIAGAAFEHMTYLVKADLSLLEIDQISQYTFADCFNLTYLYLPRTIKTIQYNTFYRCTKLTTILFPETFRVLEAGAFNLTSALRVVIFCGRHDPGLQLPSSVEKVYVTKYYLDDTFSNLKVQKRTAYCPQRKKTCRPVQNKIFSSDNILMSILFFHISLNN